MSGKAPSFERHGVGGCLFLVGATSTVEAAVLHGCMLGYLLVTSTTDADLLRVADSTAQGTTALLLKQLLGLGCLSRRVEVAMASRLILMYANCSDGGPGVDMFKRLALADSIGLNLSFGSPRNEQCQVIGCPPA